MTRIGLALGGLVLLGSLGGCRGSSDFVPGTTWNYSVRWGTQNTLVTTIKVTRKITVGGEEGFELRGPNGVSRLAERDGLLVAGELNGTRFDPPLPLLRITNPVTGEDPVTVKTWEGQMIFLKSSQTCRAKLDQHQFKDLWQSKKVKTQVATLTLTTARNRVIEIRTEYLAGTGILNQEQRTDGNFNFAIELNSKDQ